MKTSYSALETFTTCPQKYKFQEIEKRKAPKRIDQVFGTVVHGALKFMFERGPLYPTLDEVLDHYAAAWHEAAQKIARKKEGEEKLYYEEGATLLKNFYAKNKPWNFNTVELENRFSITLTDDAEVEHTLTGVVDRMDKDPNSDEYEIIDYKTGRKMPSQAMLEENMQLGLYGLAIRARWPRVAAEQIKTSLYYLKHGEKVSAAGSDEKLERAKRRILAIIGEIEKRMATDDFPPTPGPLCNFCGFRPICPMWAHEYKKDAPETPSDEEAAQAIREYFAIKNTEETSRKRLGELRAQILRYMEGQKIERVFGDGGYITKAVQERVTFDIEKARPLLEKLDLWESILIPDPKKIISLLASLPEADREALAAAETKRSFVALKTSKKK